jgi:hypothetical protein
MISIEAEEARYVKNNFRIVLFYSCVFYILLYIYISSLKNPLKLASERLAKCSYCQSFIFKKIYDPPPWGHQIPVGPGAAWSKLTPLREELRARTGNPPLYKHISVLMRGILISMLIQAYMSVLMRGILISTLIHASIYEGAYESDSHA